MIENFLFEIEHYGTILNANRSYYLSRSQPPFLTSMILSVYQAEKAAGREDREWLERAYGYAARDYQMWVDESSDPPAIVCQVGGTQLKYQKRAIDDLHAMLQAHGGWMDLGSADEHKPAAEGTVEAWGRSEANPVGGWYGMKKGLRGRFGMYMPPLMEALGLAELTHDSKNNRMRAI